MRFDEHAPGTAFRTTNTFVGDRKEFIRDKNQEKVFEVAKGVTHGGIVVKLLVVVFLLFLVGLVGMPLISKMIGFDLVGYLNAHINIPILFFTAVFSFASIIIIISGLRKKDDVGGCTMPVEATVIGFQDSVGVSSGNHGNSFYLSTTPVFFYTIGNVDYRATDGQYYSIDSSAMNMPRIDSTVTIKVNPSDPEKVIWSLTSLPKKKNTIVIGVALLLFSLGFGGFFFGLETHRINEEAAHPKMAEDGRRYLYDQELDRVNKATNENPDPWGIYERTVTGIQETDTGIVIMFEKCEGLMDGLRIKKSEVEEYSGIKPGDVCYWIQYGEAGASIYSESRYVYGGEHTVKK